MADSPRNDVARSLPTPNLDDQLADTRVPDTHDNESRPSYGLRLGVPCPLMHRGTARTHVALPLIPGRPLSPKEIKCIEELISQSQPFTVGPNGPVRLPKDIRQAGALAVPPPQDAVQHDYPILVDGNMTAHNALPSST